MSLKIKEIMNDGNLRNFKFNKLRGRDCVNIFCWTFSASISSFRIKILHQEEKKLLVKDKLNSIYFNLVSKSFDCVVKSSLLFALLFGTTPSE